MKIEVDIPEEIYEAIKQSIPLNSDQIAIMNSYISHAILSGTPVTECKAEDCIDREELLKRLLKRYKHEIHEFGEKMTHNYLCGLSDAMNIAKELPTVYSKSDKPSGKYEYHTDHTDCIWYGSDSGCPVTCSQYRDGWNDAMDYIFKNGKGYQPYRRE